MPIFSNEFKETVKYYEWIGGICTLMAGFGAAILMIIHAELSNKATNVFIKGISEIATLSVVPASPTTPTALPLLFPHPRPNLTTQVFTTVVYVTSITTLTHSSTITITTLLDQIVTTISDRMHIDDTIYTPRPLPVPAPAKTPTKTHTTTTTTTRIVYSTITYTETSVTGICSGASCPITITITQECSGTDYSWAARELEAQGHVLENCLGRLDHFVERDPIDCAAVKGLYRECQALRHALEYQMQRFGIHSGSDDSDSVNEGGYEAAMGLAFGATTELVRGNYQNSVPPNFGTPMRVYQPPALQLQPVAPQHIYPLWTPPVKNGNGNSNGSVRGNGNGSGKAFMTGSDVMDLTWDDDDGIVSNRVVPGTVQIVYPNLSEVCF
ncbi:hypothetical protein B9Z19DRAFT_1120416 [Tuber borchii]|uniref:Uncharacterized protein n=1 Tax=Tuber borchii TaxID=42251 RepID=A0A2T7A4G7_TUBBO|nr:hypothetical protein B9Z19DRAFT_1120416 [Tuber borchii]